MKILAFLIFYLSLFPLQAEVCRDNVRTVLSSSNQQHFIESGFLSKIFSELIGIIHDNEFVITDAEVRDILLQWGEQARNPKVTDLFEVSNIFGVKVADLFEHAGNLKNHIPPSNILTDKLPLTLVKKRKILERVHLHLVGMISDTLLKRNISLEQLARESGITSELFHLIVAKIQLPRLPLILQILVRLDIDVVSFFKYVETGLGQGPLKPYLLGTSRLIHVSKKEGEIEKNSTDLFNRINGELEEIFKDMRFKNAVGDVIRFKHKIYYSQREINLRQGKIRNKNLALSELIQTAHMLGMNPSEVLKYAGNLSPHIKWEGMETRTFLNDEEINILRGRVAKYLAEKVNQAKIDAKELSVMTGISKKHLKNVIDPWGVNFSYATLARIMQALGLDVIHFFEKLESLGEFDMVKTKAPFSFALWREKFKKNQFHGDFLGNRIIQIRKILLPLTSENKLDAAITRSVDTRTGRDLTQREIRFKTFYKASRVANIPLSELLGERPVKELLNPRHAKIEPITSEEIDKAERLLIHLILGELRRQKDMHDLTITGLAIKAHLLVHDITLIFSRNKVPSYSTLVQIVEDGLGIPLPRFFEKFEDKLKSYDHIPFASTSALLELGGPYFSKKVKANMNQVRERFFQALNFLSSREISMRSLEKDIGIRGYKEKQQRHSYNKINTIIKLSHFLGISLRNFVGHIDFAELVDMNRLNFERLPEEHIHQRIGAIKNNINQRRKDLGLPMKDLGIMLGSREKYTTVSSLLSESRSSFYWSRYFQVSEILARKGEDDLFLLDYVGF